MMNRHFPSAILRTAFVAGLFLTGCQAFRQLPVTIDPVSDPVFKDGFGAVVRSSPEHRRFTVLVDLTRQVDLPVLLDRLGKRRLSKMDRRQMVIHALEEVAAGQQEEMKPDLDRLLQKGALDSVRPVSIVNRLVVEGSAAGILELSDHPAIASILPDWTSENIGNGRADKSPAVLGEKFFSWGVESIGAPAVWEQGFRGRGVVVAAIDTGVFGDHEQLRGRMLPGGRGWLDPAESRLEPYDSHGHGTSVLSVAVGANADERIIGVAPEARWAVALGNRGNFYSRSRMTLAADWVLRTVRPDVVINAWSDSYGSCSDFDLPFINAWKAAEMFVVFPAGNAGPAAESDESPANLTGTVPHGGPVFSTGGLERSETGVKVYDHSSRGPNSCSGEPFPSLSAPGAELPFAYPPLPDDYGIGSGTSLAAGLVGGAAALLLEADPEIGPDELEAILIRTARDLPPEGHDPDTGAGILDLAAALAEIRKR